jgi:hypothetical protein
MSEASVHTYPGSVTLIGCRVESEAGSAVYVARTGAALLEKCEIVKCRGSGVVVAQVQLSRVQVYMYMYVCVYIFIYVCMY